jgi:macrolide-specific efflux system membrane fusion protein
MVALAGSCMERPERRVHAMRRDKRMIFGLTAGTAVLALGGVMATKHFSPAPKPGVVTAVARMGDVERAVLATASLEPSNVVDVGSEVSGRVISLKVGLGDVVKKGDLIAEIDPTRLASQVRQQQQSIAQAEANLRDRLAQLEVLRSNADRQKELYDRGINSKAVYELALANLNSANAQIENRRQQLDNEKLVLEQRQNELEKAKIRAPIDGVVAQVVTREGQTININFGTPVIVKLAQTRTMTVRAQVSEADIMKVRPGQKAYFTILGEPENRHYAKVADLEVTPAGATLDPDAAKGTGQGAVYYNVTFDTPNPDQKLLPSMTAEVHVVLDEAHDVLTVPATAVESAGDGKHLVQVAGPDGRITPREVEVGVDNNFTVEIKKGLKAGEKVVVGSAQPAES